LLGRAASRRSLRDAPFRQHERQYRLSAGDRAQQAGLVIPRGQPLITEAEPGGAQQREQEPHDGSKNLRAASQPLDPVQQLLSVLVELFEGDEGPPAAASPRGGGRARDVETIVLREGAVPAYLIAETVVLRAASLEEERGHGSRIAATRDRARADQAGLAPPKSRHFNDVASANCRACRSHAG